MNPLQDMLGSASLMMVTRMLNLATGLVMLPVLIHNLGGTAFAAWAVLLASSAFFSNLDAGMPGTLVKYAAVPLNDSDWPRLDSVRQHSLVILVATYACAAPLVFWAVGPLARQLKLPDGELLTAATMLMLVYCAVFVRSILLRGTQMYYAARNFRAVALVSFCQPFVSNCTAMVAASTSHQLDVMLVSFWGAQLAVVGTALLMFRLTYARASVNMPIAIGLIREMLGHGMKTQLSMWAQVVIYQFDKFLIAWIVGLWAVAPYEVSNRAVQALRSVPASGIQSLLPAAAISHATGADAWGHYRAMTRLATHAAIAFMIVPLTVAPIFLFAWTGEMGYVGRWVFVVLLVGAAIGVLTIPAATMLQAAGRAGTEARASIAAVVLNVLLSTSLVTTFGMNGAVFGTGIAMLLSSMLLFHDVHRLLGRPATVTMRVIGEFWPLVAICLAWGLVNYLVFSQWFATLEGPTRFSRQTRYLPGLAAVASSTACLMVLFLVQLYRGGFRAEELALLARIPGLRRFLPRQVITRSAARP